MTDPSASEKLDNHKADPLRLEVVDFVLENGFKVVRLGQNKNPIDKGWNDPAVYEPKQNEWLDGFLHGYWYLGLICGVKCKNGYYIVVWDADSKEAYELVKQFENQTTVVKSGGEKEKRSDSVGKDVSRHFYFFSPTLPRTKRHEKGEPAYDFQSKGVQVCLPCTIHPKTHRDYTFLNKVSPMIWDGDIELDFQHMREEAFGVKDGKKEPIELERVDIIELQNGVEKGLRDDAAIKIASRCRAQGKSQEETYEILRTVNAKNKPPVGSDSEDPNEDAWIKAKIQSAWRPKEPYRFNFIEKESYNQTQMAQALELLDHPEKALFYFHEALGDVVREHKTKVLLLVLVFAKQSVEVTGKSGSGKSELVKSVIKCFPKSWSIQITGLTDKALRWLEDYVRILVIAERKGMQTGEESNAEYDIKTSISEGEIRIIFPEKGPDGKLHKGEKVVKIDTYVFTSTDPAPPEELENRINNIVSDESEEQNIAVIRYISKQYQLPPAERTSKSCEEMKTVLRCYFEILEKEAPHDVVIPYLPLIIERFFVPYAKDPAVRRHGYKLVNFVQSMSKIFYKSLPTVGTAVVASPEIFWYVWQLAEETIFSELIALNPRQLKVWQIVDTLLNQFDTVSVSQIAERSGYAPGHVKRFLDLFERKSLVEIERQGRSIEVKRLGQMQFGQTCISEKATFSLAELETAYEEWLKTHNCTLAQNPPSSIPLTDPTTGQIISCNPANVVFKLGDICKTKIVVEKQSATKIQESFEFQEENNVGA
jgi:hypothetical protein